MTTEEALEKITDEGVFEKIVTGILRVADPAYSRLIHVGVNAQGKTIKAPVDGIVPVGSGHKFAVTAFTTTALKSLRTKWLNTTDGDVLKGIQELTAARAADPDRPATLVLATNRAPGLKLLNDVGKQCSAADVELDLWERSRLANFLDNNAEGQWLRQKMLGIQAERLSLDLLLSLSAKSLVEFSNRIPNSSKLTGRKDEVKVTNRALNTGLTILSAPSGFGKTAVALRIMNTWLQQGRPTLWIPETVLEQESTLSSTINRLFQELHGSPVFGNAIQTIGSIPFLVVIDDIARINEPSRMLEKVMAWTSGQRGGKSHYETAIHLLVPTWPEFLIGIRQDLAKELGPHIIELETLDKQEALRLYRCRVDDTHSTEDELSRVIERLGRDPLLIDLHNPDNPDETPEEIVRLWIERQLSWVSKETGVPVHQFKVALSILTKNMLIMRTMAPSAQETEAFFAQAHEYYDYLCKIIQNTAILRWDTETGKEVVAFRHDRIRDALLSDALREFIGTDQAENVIADPYYADHFSEAIVQSEFAKELLEIAAAFSPLAMFAALKRTGKAREAANPSLIKLIREFLAAQRKKKTFPDVFFWAAANLLKDADGLEVEELCNLLTNEKFRVDEALIRNGNVDVALNYMVRFELGTKYSRRDQIIKHASGRQSNFIPDVTEHLVREDLSSEEKIKGLLLAGFCGRPELGAAVEKCITQTPIKGPDEVESAMWAVTQCCGDNLERCLDVVLKAFADLSPERTKDGTMPSERDDALFDLGGKRIASDLPQNAVSLIIDQCQKRPDIADDLNFFLYRINDPIALTYWVRQRAKKIREDRKAGRKTLGFFAFHDEWRRDLRYGRTMNAESRHALWKIWSNVKEAEEDRETAFHLWKAQASVIDIPLLKSVTADGKLSESILQTRVSLGDKSAYESFLEQVENCPPKKLFFWWQFARGVMDAQLAQGVDQCLNKYDDSIGGDPIHILSELIMELPPELAEPIIVKHWDKLKQNPEFFQAALYVGTEKTKKLAADSFRHISDKHTMLRHLEMHFGFNVEGRSQKITEKHLKSLEPYLDYVDSQQLFFLWSDCNRHKFFEWRRNHLDNRVTEIKDDRVNHDLSSRENLLDNLCKEGHVWYDWVRHNFLDLGYTLDEAFEAIAEWAEKRGTEDAIKVAADLFFNAANRSHLTLFDRLVANSPLKATIQPQVHFGVKYRTLS